MCIRIVEVLVCEALQVLRNRRVKWLSRGEPYIGRACSLLSGCMAEIFLGPLCQDLSKEYTGESISAHCSLWGEERCPWAVRYIGGSIDSSVDILILVQVWRSDQRWDGIIIIKTTYAEVPGALLFNGMLSCWTNLSALHSEHHTQEQFWVVL
jgi:hypothetical protein